jgi:type IV pilus assembly protein PilO
MAIGAELRKRDGILVTVAVAFFALVALYWYYPYTDRKEELAALSSRVELLNSRNQEARAAMASGGVASVQAEAEQYGRMLEMLRQLVPLANEVPVLLEQVSTASRREGLELGGITPMPVIEGPEFDTHRFGIGLVGGYHQIARFLTNVGTLPRSATVVNVTLRDRERLGGSLIPRKPNQALVQVDFELRTYVARTSSMAALPPPE